MKSIEPWVFHPLISDYAGTLDCIKIDYEIGSGMEIQFEDAERIPIKDAKSGDPKVRAAYTYTFRFRNSFFSMRICNMESNIVISSKVLEWAEEHHLERPFCQVFRLTSSEYIDWINQTDICGTYNTPIPGLVHYLFVTADQIIEIVDNEEPQIEVKPILEDGSAILLS